MRLLAICLLSALLAPGVSSAQASARIKNVPQLIQKYRQASDTLQEAASDRMLAYCVFREWNAGKPDRNNLKVSAGLVAGVRSAIDEISGKMRIDQIIADSTGKLQRLDIPVPSTLANMLTGLIPLDTDTYRVLRQTVEYDKRNRQKFENFAGGIEGLASGGVVQSEEPLRKPGRLAGNYGFSGLLQTVGYVQRDFQKEFNGKKMLNFGKCAGAAERVLAVQRSIQVELDVLKEIVEQLLLDGAEL